MTTPITFVYKEPKREKSKAEKAAEADGKKSGEKKSVLAKQYAGKTMTILSFDGSFAQVEAVDGAGIVEYFAYVPCDRIFDKWGRSALQLISGGILQVQHTSGGVYVPGQPQGASSGKIDGLKVIVAGSRSVKSLELVKQAIAQSGFSVAEVVSGTAKGVDQLGEQWANEQGIPCRQFPANWEKNGRRAGYIRNTEMAEYADALVAVWDGVSRGTSQMIGEARRLGLKVFVFTVEAEAIAARHTCHAVGCPCEVEPKLLMCRAHWSIVPKTLQDAIWQTYRPGQEADKKPSAEYLKAQQAAIQAVLDHEWKLEHENGDLLHVVNLRAIRNRKGLANVIVAMETKGHPLGNPWYKEANHDRPGCIAKFKRYLWQQYNIEGSAVREAIDAIAQLLLKGEHVYLACCCKPLACHCDEIKALIDKIVIPRFLEVAA